MINIQIIGSPISQIIVNGHANSANYGKDIVCAGVSAIVTGTINALKEITNINPKYKIEDGYCEIKFSGDDLSQTVAKTMMYQLKTIEESYSKNVKIKYSQSEV